MTGVFDLELAFRVLRYVTASHELVHNQADVWQSERGLAIELFLQQQKLRTRRN